MDKITEIARKIEHVLEHGSDKERQSLLDAVGEVSGLDEKLRLENWATDKRVSAGKEAA
jgi:hypothetical protein